ncbi:thioredoxin family protein [Desulfuromonas thiophila]|uniref:Protein disulfide-isomerase n=1 Tax=Desulfuromonas thiophila TaxID=57664 RepID=A0A1G6Z1B8_9BACT|nr:thioredoxin family protein [Desulfuromonas thiophila]SDD96410.1 protein disulfide-isomerase [Desulfuromonas thiophila]
MKRPLLLLIALLLFPSVVLSASLWLEDSDRAFTQAREQQRPVLMYFTGSDWCHWCIQLNKNVLSQPEFADFAAKELVLLKVDFPKRLPQSAAQARRNDQLARQYRVRGFPTLLLFNAAGDKIATTGFRPGSAADYVTHLQELLK